MRDWAPSKEEKQNTAGLLAIAAIMVACTALAMVIALYAQVRDLRAMIGG